MSDPTERIRQLAERGIFLIDGLGPDAPPADPAAEDLVFSSFLDEYPREALIDLTQAARLYGASHDAAEALLRSRVRFQGTDGIRGKVDFGGGEYLRRFLAEHVITPDLIRNNCYSFAELLIDREVIRPGEAVLVGEDGRDLFGERALSEAMKAGFAGAGLVVLDLGLAPTPEVPYQMLSLGVRAAAVLTASHNPSNQNGLKLFLDGKKLLPEGDIGDYTLSAYQYKNSLQPLPPAGKRQVRPVADAQRERFVEFLIANLPAARSRLPDVRLVCDPANGALSRIAPAVLERLGADVHLVNAEPNGRNINQGGGVAELEGTDRIEGRVDASVFAGYLPSIQAMFEQGRSTSKPAFGLSFDGDGDRGYVLAYDRDDDALIVVDGDRAGFILARSMARRDPAAAEKYFLSTVESDLMTNYFVAERIGCRTEICPVGDKWLSTFDRGEVLLAEESSGHIIIPAKVLTPTGEETTLLTGNGLQAVLHLLCCVLEERLTPDDLARPFDAGASGTNYVYNVDRSLFAKDSDVWRADIRILQQKADELKSQGSLDADCELRFVEKPEDPDMLLALLVDVDDRVAGTVFARNSGTEVKTASCFRGKRQLQRPLAELAGAINRNHIAMMKDESSPEFRMERIVLDAIEQRGGLEQSQAALVIEQATGTRPSDPTVSAIVYGLRKENRVELQGDLLVMVN